MSSFCGAYSCLTHPNAGSERVGRSEVAGEQLREAQAINRSLSALGDVIAALQRRGPHIPFRNSKLTQVMPLCTHAPPPLMVLRFKSYKTGCVTGWYGRLAA